MNSARAMVFIAVLALVGAACSGGGSAASVSPPAASDVTIDAKGLAFVEKEVMVPAGRPFAMFFRNLDDAPHNVAIYSDSSLAKSLFVGETITDATKLYTVPALEPGTYFFRCDLHPAMTGSLVAGN
jgi:plastocyanin